mmetsp:Transcript_5596/g.13135  ORF Transcript_5596/g.13135 Transcript_5596/m.13135 type:complete len:296 (+) Transcript_5596:268-1155(+)
MVATSKGPRVFSKSSNLLGRTRLDDRRGGCVVRDCTCVSALWLMHCADASAKHARALQPEGVLAPSRLVGGSTGGIAGGRSPEAIKVFSTEDLRLGLARVGHTCIHHAIRHFGMSTSLTSDGSFLVVNRDAPMLQGTVRWMGHAIVSSPDSSTTMVVDSSVKPSLQIVLLLHQMVVTSHPPFPRRLVVGINVGYAEARHVPLGLEMPSTFSAFAVRDDATVRFLAELIPSENEVAIMITGSCMSLSPPWPERHVLVWRCTGRRLLDEGRWDSRGSTCHATTASRGRFVGELRLGV